MFALVDANNFYVSCERVFDRSLVGRPVAVLSNNDGCCVSMSAEFKALGIPRGTPYFKLKDRESRRAGDGGLVFLSSNYELYGDMSRRIISILREEACAVEQYSIDEAFIAPPARPLGRVTGDGGGWFRDYGVALREKILRWVGIPCGIGFAPTKTLAKIANHLAKKETEGVFVLPEDPTDILAQLPVDEVWGVGRRLQTKLRAERIHTARDLREASDEVVRAVGGVTLLRTALELRGIASNQEAAYEADPDSVSCSRSFAEPVTTREALVESVACFVAEAAVKLRRHRMLAAGCSVYAAFGDRKSEGWEGLAGSGLSVVDRTVMFREPTDATNVMMSDLRRAVEALHRPGVRYRKTGLVLFGLEHRDAPQQADLFEEKPTGGASALYEVVDRMNRRFGKGSVGLATEGLRFRKPLWSMRRDKLSAVSTTAWSRLPVGHAT